MTHTNNGRSGGAASRRLPALARVAALWLAVLAATQAFAAECPGNSDVLGTSRVLEVDAAKTPRVGRKQFPATLPLAEKDVVLTFDDGPWPATTPKVLDALKHECVRATFFLIGRNAEAAPALVRREKAEGHTVATHTFSHPLLSRRSLAAAESEIDHGVAAVAAALQDSTEHPQPAPFFRFPGFASTPALLDRLAQRRVVVFGADLWASDWNPMTPAQELRLVLARLQWAGRGIILFHDTKGSTAAMLPALLRELKARGYRIVHVVPANPTP